MGRLGVFINRKLLMVDFRLTIDNFKMKIYHGSTSFV
jgi:hypothetical protein